MGERKCASLTLRCMCDVDAHLTRESCDLCASKLEKSKKRKYRDARNAGRRLAQWNHELNIGTKSTSQILTDLLNHSS
jgi:hypothetical protein